MVHLFNKMRVFLLVIFALISFTGYSQTIKISGTITDATDGSPLIGATVLEKNTSNGTVTNLDGLYSLEVKQGAFLVFSYIGYEKQEIQISSTTLNVQMNPTSEMLEEVLVIGYGVQKKSDKTGAVTMVESEQLNAGRLSDPIQAMQGKAAGVVISKKGGDPNGGFSVRIRGASGLTSNTDPLYVVDGVPGVDPTTIAPEEIASFNILKDASSTAIYGSRGANGVIIITTKTPGISKGKKTSTVEYNGYVSFDQVAKKLDFLSADQIRNFASENNLTFIDEGANTDWQDEIFKPGLSQSHNVAFSGSDENSSYRASVTHNDITGILAGTGKERSIGRLNLTQKALDDRLTLQARLSGTLEHNNYVNYEGFTGNNVIYQAYRRNPTDPVFNPDGSYFETDKSFQYFNPVAISEQYQNERDAKRLLGNFKADLKIFEGLTGSVNLAYIRDDNENFYFEPRAAFSNTTLGLGRRSYDNHESKLLESTLNYQKKINNTHNINLVGGYAYQMDTYDGFTAEGKNATSDLIQSNNLESFLELNPGSIKSYKNEFILISFFGRAIYDYKSKYYLTATLRRDGSSKFGSNNEWGWFPSASLSWNIKNEDFLKDVNFIDQMKLRIGYGITGNQDIPVYVDAVYRRPAGPTIDPETGEPAIVYEVAGDVNANPDLKWEENAELNIGLDFGILNNRISGSIEYYRKQTYDLIYQYSVPVPPNKSRYTYANGGIIENNGLEMSLQAFVIDRHNFDYKTVLTFSSNKPVTKTLSTDIYNVTNIRINQVEGRGLVGGINNTFLIGEGIQLGSWYMPEYAGLSSDGQFLFHSKTGGVTRDVQKAELRHVGNAQPDFQIGWSNYFTFGRFDASISLRAVYGYKVMNVTKMVFGNPQDLPTLNVLESALDEWDRGLNDNPTVSSYYLEDASFIKIDNISFGYNFELPKSNYITSLRVYASSSNLFTFTKYTGLDPELSYSENSLEFGLDNYDVYPKTRTITIGVNAKF
ncbi:MAG: SusC/RagA family TonB-linked outer membrane protein [Bacteroidales bacterium]|nr:SusC/RagA family TonB-linked outer membrane protein [Bacteroidales bacterium]